VPGGRAVAAHSLPRRGPSVKYALGKNKHSSGSGITSVAEGQSPDSFVGHLILRPDWRSKLACGYHAAKVLASREERLGPSVGRRSERGVDASRPLSGRE
jgi:hypothetical protein